MVREAAILGASMPMARTLLLLLFTVAVFSTAHGGQSWERGVTAIPADRFTCPELLELEKLLELKSISSTNASLFIDNANVVGWLQGFLSGLNAFDKATDGDITKGSTPREWMRWIFAYCPGHLSASLAEAAIELANAFKEKSGR
jgi:hypothetical protein